MKNSTEIVAFMLRKTGMTLTEIRKALDRGQLVKLYNELAFQESVEAYNKMSMLASILAAIANTVPRKNKKVFKASDFLMSKPPRRPGSKGAEQSEHEKLETLAAIYGIKLPSRELREL